LVIISKIIVYVYIIVIAELKSRRKPLGLRSQFQIGNLEARAALTASRGNEVEISIAVAAAQTYRHGNLCYDCGDLAVTHEQTGRVSVAHP
jgi:hypothetical protein